MKAFQKQLIGVALILFLIVYWIASEVFYAHGKSPVGIATVSDFHRIYGRPTFVRRYQRDGQVFYHLFGRDPHFPWLLAFPSSPPAYVFDSSGRFVEWSPDPGDDTHYQQKWPLRDGQLIDPAALPNP